MQLPKDSKDSHIGQLVFYLLGVHLKQLATAKKKQERVLPILGLYMEGLAVSVCKVILHQLCHCIRFRYKQSLATSLREENCKLTFYLSDKIQDLNKGVAHAIAVLHKFLALDHDHFILFMIDIEVFTLYIQYTSIFCCKLMVPMYSVLATATLTLGANILLLLFHTNRQTKWRCCTVSTI